MEEEISRSWSRARTCSVIARDNHGAILHRWKGVVPAESQAVLQDLKTKHPTLTITRHLDVHSECQLCGGSGLRPANKRYGCTPCDGTGRLISDTIGIEI
jgi:hypothetical protein